MLLLFERLNICMLDNFKKYSDERATSSFTNSDYSSLRRRSNV
jgi:hypothetical protein